MESRLSQNRIAEAIAESIAVKRRLLEECSQDVQRCGELLIEVYRRGGKALLCGNGGSAADSQHLAAELVVRLRGYVNRAAIPAIALTVDSSILTAGGNDLGFENVFARQVEAYGRPGDGLIAISTSGNSENVLRAVQQAQRQQMSVIGLLGAGGGRILPYCTAAVVVPSHVTARIQEAHILVGHIWCEMLEEALFPELFA
ncbi:MAG: SIS domain-containing protein [Candidatus Kapabacteria bacterium]|nr:SIS domain-containing protein [Candidatus Kapabacteria bacterium]MDW7996235.1 SIS domain-containing protein [Bacteroidota bacterium]MDW8225238.1 SIS domain-containing protein [Bacteroidota bacterium]